VIELHDIRFKYDTDDWVLNGIDLSIGPAEYVLVCGANGSGKSTLGYLLNGLIPHFMEGEFIGNVMVDGNDTRNLTVADLAEMVGLVLQNPEAQLFNATVAEDIAFGLESLGLDAGVIDARLAQVVRSLHIDHLLDRSPTELSGGEKRLAAIAAVLALEPSVVVLDEPFADLDWDGVELVRRQLRDLHQTGKTVIVIEQRLESVLNEASRCIILENGKVFFDGAPAKGKTILSERQLIPNYPERMPRTVTDERPILAVQNLHFRVNGEEILKDISFKIKKGESVALIGRNGAGKTTLIKHFNALLRPHAGSVLVLGEDVRRKRINDLAANVGLSFQNPNDQFFKLRVDEELRTGPKLVGKVDEKWIDNVFKIFELDELLDRSPYRLSEGEKKRVGLASIFSMQPPVVVLDEPTAGQDGHFKEALVHFLRMLEDFGFTLIIVTHDFEFARAATDRWVLLEDGRVVGDGPPRLFAEKMHATYGESAINHKECVKQHDDKFGKAAIG